SEASIEDQVRSCKARIEAEGWQLVATYSDHAISGSIRLRPGYQKMLEDSRTGAFNVLVTEGLDRVTRDLEDVAALYKHLPRRRAAGTSSRASNARSGRSSKRSRRACARRP